MPQPSPKAYPYLSVGVLEIFYNGGGDQARAIGSGFVFQSDKYPRRDLMLGAGHNLVHLGDGFEEALFTLYANRDVNGVAVRKDGSRRYAIDDTGLPNDVGVMVLAEPVAVRVDPLKLWKVEPGDDPLLGAAAGGLARLVEKRDRTIYFSDAQIRNDVMNCLYCETGTTEPGMSGGPVLVAHEGSATAVGIVHGAGALNQKPYDLATRVHIDVIEMLVAKALNGE